MLAIIDYGVGNLFSLKSSLTAIDVDAVVSGDPQVLRSADRLILPGVGAFGDAAEKLRATGLDAVLCEEASKGKPVMGICLGMQLLFEKGFEYGEHKGLGLLKGEILPISGFIPSGLIIPHMGWNSLKFVKSCPLQRYINEGEYVYFVHSYAAVNCEDSLAAVTDYGGPVTAMVCRDNIYGCQFHPEKSGPAGLSILKAFCELQGRAV